MSEGNGHNPFIPYLHPKQPFFLGHFDPNMTCGFSTRHSPVPQRYPLSTMKIAATMAAAARAWKVSCFPA